MKQGIFIALMLFVALFIEASILQLPLVLVSLIALSGVFQKTWIFFVAFVSGIFLDILLFHPIGGSSIFLVLIAGVIFIYKKKFEVQSIQFIFFFSFFTSLVYVLLFGSVNVFLQALCSAGLAILLFIGVTLFAMHVR